MSEQETEQGGTQYDAPNQQVVRPDGSGPADEGTGGQEAQPKSRKKTEKSESKSETKPSEKKKDDD